MNWNTRARVRSATAIAVLSCAWVAGCVSPGTDVTAVEVSPAVVRSAVRFTKEYVLAPGDQVEIHVRRTPEVSRTVMIRPDGRISLPLLDEVEAAGKTPRELDALLTERLSERLIDPEVTVIAVQVRQPVVYVTGDVGQAAVVPLREAPTAMQAIAFAGGLRRSAAERDIAILRLAEDGHLQAILVTPPGSGQVAPYMELRRTLLQADDVIFVPESTRSQVARGLDDFINRPLQGLNSLVGTYVNFRLVEEITGDN